MDRTTKLTLWVAFVAITSYIVWAFVDCATDSACRIECMAGGRRGCYPQWTRPPAGEPTGLDQRP